MVIVGVVDAGEDPERSVEAPDALDRSDLVEPQIGVAGREAKDRADGECDPAQDPAGSERRLTGHHGEGSVRRRHSWMR
jgi:hypothetical protein